MDTIFQQLPNGGAVIAIIAVVILFLRNQEKGEDRRESKLQAIVTRFTDELSSSRQDYLDHLRDLTGRNPRDTRNPPRNP